MSASERAARRRARPACRAGRRSPAATGRTAFQRLQTAGELGSEDTMALGTSAFLAGDADAAVRAWQHGYQERVRPATGWAPLAAPSGSAWCSTCAASGRSRPVGRPGRNGSSRPSPRTSSNGATCSSTSSTPTSVAGTWPARRRPGPGGAGRSPVRRPPTWSPRGWSAWAGSPSTAAGCGRVWPCWTRPWWGSPRARSRRCSPVMVYCTVIEGCQELADFSRMSSWTRALTRWCEAQPGLVPFTGQCSLHRGQILRLHGAFDDALVEFRPGPAPGRDRLPAVRRGGRGADRAR